MNLHVIELVLIAYHVNISRSRFDPTISDALLNPDAEIALLETFSFRVFDDFYC